MERSLQFNRIHFVLLTMVCTIQANVVDHMYRKLEPGRNITGTIVTKISYKSNQECALMCLLDDWCLGCATTGDERYAVIQRRGTIEQKQTLVSDVGGTIYIGNYTGNYITVTWNPPSAWNGPPAILYFDFDTLTGLGLMAGNGVSNYDPLVPGKINKAVMTRGAYYQWVDLGVLSQACITVPDTCGPEGAAVSFWIKIHSCSSTDGFLSSMKYSSTGRTGFTFFCFGSSVRNYVAVKTRSFWGGVPKTNDQWIHLVLNFIGPNGGEGIQSFKDGTVRDSHQQGRSGTHTAGDGRVVVGRRYVSTSYGYSKVEVDELIFFNEALLEEEVSDLYNMNQ